MSFNPFTFVPNTDTAPQDTIKDDLELPPGEEMNFEAMAEAVKTINTSAASQEQPADGVTLPTPTTPRPMLPPSQDSEAHFADTYPKELRRPSDAEHETSDDPDEDVMSMNTDINRHERTLSTITRQLEDMTKKTDLLPDMISQLKRLSTRSNEFENSITKLSYDLENMRKSFNMYQSSTANKIADVERRAAEKQLSTTAIPSTDIIPPAEIHESRAPKTPANQSQESPSPISTQPAVQKKKAIIHDW